MTFALALEVFVAGLLVITIGLAGVLNHRLGKLRRDRADLEKLTAEFQQATARASDASHNLTVDAEQLSEGIEKAQSLKDDLTFLIERAAGAADQLEDRIRASRNAGERAAPAPRPAAARVVAPTEGTAPRSQAERDLLQALRAAS